MVKIKREVKKNLPQLIEWVWKSEKSDVKAKYFKCKEGNEIKHIIYANPTGRLNLDSERYYDKNDLFTVEVEEVVDEDTVLPILIERRDFGNELTYSRYEYVRIKDIKEESSALFYIENDDLTMTLIWKNGKLVK